MGRQKERSNLLYWPKSFYRCQIHFMAMCWHLFSLQILNSLWDSDMKQTNKPKTNISKVLTNCQAPLHYPHLLPPWGPLSYPSTSLSSCVLVLTRLQSTRSMDPLNRGSYMFYFLPWTVQSRKDPGLGYTFFFWDSGSHYVAQAGMEIPILLVKLPRCQDTRYVPPCPTGPRFKSIHEPSMVVCACNFNMQETDAG